MYTSVLALVSIFPALQTAAAPTPVPVQGEAPTAEGLRRKVHKLRMDLLLGGEQVQRAETEAVGFYEERLGLIDRRLDRIDVDLSEKQASYQLALAKTIESPTGSSIREASRLRSKVVALEGEAARLRGKRAQLAAVVDGILDRGTEREALAASLAANNGIPLEAGLPASMIGLAPGEVEATVPSPFDDPQLVRELVTLDPIRGRIALFEADPEGYWRFYTLQPPATVLSEALVFPMPDLPGNR